MHGYFSDMLHQGLLLALVTTSGLTIVQSLIFKHPKLRAALKIATIPATKQAGLPSPIATLQEYVIRPTMNILRQKSTKKYTRKERPSRK